VVTPKEPDQLVAHFRRERLCLDAARRLDGGPDLLQIGATVGTGPKVGFETPALASRERALKIIGHELDRLLAKQVLAEQPHARLPPQVVVEESANSIASSVKQHSLVGLGDRQQVAHLIT
jgi:hypothetical protein